MAFRENVERYGMWFPVEEKDESSPVEDMFLEEEVEKSSVEDFVSEVVG